MLMAIIIWEFFELTEPEFSVQIPKPSSVVSPVTVEIQTTVLTSLKHLQLYRNHHHHRRRHHHHEKHIGSVTNCILILHLHNVKKTNVLVYNMTFN